jgi:hypothetical protein
MKKRIESENEHLNSFVYAITPTEGDWRVPLQPHGSKFQELEPTPRPTQTKDSIMKEKNMKK